MGLHQNEKKRAYNFTCQAAPNLWLYLQCLEHDRNAFADTACRTH